MDYYKIPDSLVGKNKFQIEINQLPIDTKYPNYRIFELKQFDINIRNNDTIAHIFYYTTIHENQMWKILWTQHLLVSGTKFHEEQKFEESINICEKALQYDPLNGNTYCGIGWIYLRLEDLSNAEIYAKKAVEYSPKLAENYNLIASIYHEKGRPELAIENYEKAIHLSTTEDNKVDYYSNMSSDYMDMNQPEKAKEMIYKSLKIDSTDTYALWIKAYLYSNEKKQDSSIMFFDKAIHSEPMTNYLQKRLYYGYAEELYLVAIKNKGQYNKAKTFAIKALDLEPNNTDYIELLNKINKAIESSSN